jgi:hypothetical protein
MATLSLVAFEVEIFVQGLGGPLETLLPVWSVARWAVAFVVVTAALSVLYYLAPDARVPVQVDHAGRFRRDGPDVRRERGAELLRLQARQLRPDLRPARARS